MASEGPPLPFSCTSLSDLERDLLLRVNDGMTKGGFGAWLAIRSRPFTGCSTLADRTVERRVQGHRV